MNQEMPAMASVQYRQTTHDPNVNYLAAAAQGRSIVAQGFDQPSLNQQQAALRAGQQFNAQQNQKPKKEIDMPNARRIVQVFVADVDDNIPLDKCLLYSGEQKLTDLTDQELFFELDIKRILDEHNEKVRTVTTNKAVKERTEKLEPARIRDLKMTVVTVATF